MNIPRVDQPERYAGLFIYDFGDHVSVGYTAEEIDILARSELHKSGSAYQIYRVTERGAMELRGVESVQVGAQEAMLFQFHDRSDAAAAFNDLVRLADRDPLPTPVHAERATAESMNPPHVIALVYSLYGADALGRWLQRVGFSAGDEVSVGVDRLVEYRRAVASADQNLQTTTAWSTRPCHPDDSVELAANLDHRARSTAEILATVSRSVQR